MAELRDARVWELRDLAIAVHKVADSKERLLRGRADSSSAGPAKSIPPPRDHVPTRTSSAPSGRRPIDRALADVVVPVLEEQGVAYYEHPTSRRQLYAPLVLSAVVGLRAEMLITSIRLLSAVRIEVRLSVVAVLRHRPGVQRLLQDLSREALFVRWDLLDEQVTASIGVDVGGPAPRDAFRRALRHIQAEVLERSLDVLWAALGKRSLFLATWRQERELGRKVREALQE